ncbi:hypothetical protein M0657_001551 [Pyricularia oryzae]|nr:hypothetical protein M0657_001551 [Pyricularia oryzae]KAI7931106.1 hypothetical protein M9X92_000392 [Pyricularia oryzae]
MRDFPSSYNRDTYGTNRNGKDITVISPPLIQLDQPAASKHGLCFVSCEQTIGFGCVFDNVRAAIAALDDLKATPPGPERARVLRNEAGRCDGVWGPVTIGQLQANEESRTPRHTHHLGARSVPKSTGSIAREDAAGPDLYHC